MERLSYPVLAVVTLVVCSIAASGFSQIQPQRPVKPDRGGSQAPTDSAGQSLAASLPSLDDKTRRGLAMQVALDRAGFSPGEIDGAPGTNTDRAMAAYKTARGTTDLGEVYTNPVAIYMISAADEAGPFVDAIPEDMVEKSKLPSLSYTSVLELLGERFHASPTLLQRLNPDAKFVRGEIILVPNVEPFLAPGLKTAAQQTDVNTAGTGRSQTRLPSGDQAPTPDVDSASTPGNSSPGPRAQNSTPKGPVTVIVTERTKTLEVQDASGAVMFHAPVTVGSENDPLPIGEWKVNGVGRNPVFNYNPNLFWDADASDAKAKIAAGPNNPVGVVWIDLSKEHYGIHGTPEPSRIGYTESHGCIRLTNWEAMRVAALVAPGTKVTLR